MKKYSRTELHKMCVAGDIKQICEELYDELYENTPCKPMHSGDKFIMNLLRKEREKLQNSRTEASIVIIHNDIPCLVVHRNNKPEHNSISSVYIPFQSEEDINQVIYRIYDVRAILDALSYDDHYLKTHGLHNPLFKNYAKM